MSLRPRYSLLTLLVLTALVAGGVKLWYGPHHVSSEEEEYIYTRDWSGKQIIDGPRVSRSYSKSNELRSIGITCYRDGRPLVLDFIIWARRPGEEQLNWFPNILTRDQNPMSEMESNAFYDAVFREKQKVIDLGFMVDSGFMRYPADQAEQEANFLIQ